MRLSVEKKRGSIALGKKIQTVLTEVHFQGSTNQIIPLSFTHPAPGTPEYQFTFCNISMGLTSLGNEKEKKVAYRHELTISDLEITKRALRSPFFILLFSPLQKTSFFFLSQKNLVLFLRYFNHYHCFPVSWLLLSRT